jgi:3-keto-L-gulonate-6-phosphate decarboxylase
MRDVEFIMAGGITKEAIDEYQKENMTNFLVGTMLHEGNL